MMKDEIRQLVTDTLEALGLPEADFVVEHPADKGHGDYAVNVAMVLAKEMKQSPRELAERIVDAVNEKLSSGKDDNINKVDIAGPGFINFHLSREYFNREIEDILKKGNDYGKGDAYRGKLVMCEYTDPNPFKELHIGHLVPNGVGEAVSRLIEFAGADVRRMVYQGDVGMQIAKSVWGMRELAAETPSEEASLDEKAKFLGKCYALGATKYKEDELAQKDMVEINKAIYHKSNPEIMALYDLGRKWSMDKFEEIYEVLGTKFDYYTPESEVWKMGAEEVRKNPEVFPESEGARIFRGEEHGFHTRVFLTKEDLPPYEAKDLGLMLRKFQLEPDLDLSITVTGSEQKDYFDVVKAAMAVLYPDRRNKIVTLFNGMLQIPSGKMSSRTGNIVSGEELIENMRTLSRKKMEGRDGMGDDEKEAVATQIAVAAIKYSTLKQAIGKDFVFDPTGSLSFEGDSGPYVQYSRARAMSVLRKARENNLGPKLNPNSAGGLEKFLTRFPEVAESAALEYAPQYLVTYITELASQFNTFYNQHQIVDLSDKKTSAHRVAITAAVAQVLKNGLWLLGIEAPERM